MHDIEYKIRYEIHSTSYITYIVTWIWFSLPRWISLFHICFLSFLCFFSLAKKESKHSLKNLGAEGCKGTKDPTFASLMRRKPLKQHTNESYLGVSCKRKFIIKFFLEVLWYYWWKKSGKPVVYLIIFQGFIHASWLFGISSINSS